jgi:hypothetical protein
MPRLAGFSVAANGITAILNGAAGSKTRLPAELRLRTGAFLHAIGFGRTQSAVDRYRIFPHNDFGYGVVVRFGSFLGFV